MLAVEVMSSQREQAAADTASCPVQMQLRLVVDVTLGARVAMSGIAPAATVNSTDALSAAAEAAAVCLQSLDAVQGVQLLPNASKALFPRTDSAAASAEPKTVFLNRVELISLQRQEATCPEISEVDRGMLTASSVACGALAL